MVTLPVASPWPSPRSRARTDSSMKSDMMQRGRASERHSRSSGSRAAAAIAPGTSRSVSLEHSEDVSEIRDGDVFPSLCAGEPGAEGASSLTSAAAGSGFAIDGGGPMAAAAAPSGLAFGACLLSGSGFVVAASAPSRLADLRSLRRIFMCFGDGWPVFGRPPRRAGSSVPPLLHLRSLQSGHRKQVVGSSRMVARGLKSAQIWCTHFSQPSHCTHGSDTSSSKRRFSSARFSSCPPSFGPSLPRTPVASCCGATATAGDDASPSSMLISSSGTGESARAAELRWL
mmetsp:Transcript_37455/g.117079  ORF Transcript_37455/g.117079 Transcript_37455/m.117079 type:complete len:286 (-) Transcript_37455:1299-2156(-)